MEDNFKYDPEDIESLLMHKQFNELYEEEKQFVLQHVAGEEEYESLRKTLFELHDATDSAEWIEPDPELKKELMAQFASERKGRFRIWLNSLFASRELSWYRRPEFALALVTTCIVGVVFILINSDRMSRVTATLIEQETTGEAPAKSDSITEGENLFAENLSAKSFPPAPQVMQSNIPTEVASDVPMEESISEVNITRSADDADIPVVAGSAEDLPVTERNIKSVQPSASKSAVESPVSDSRKESKKQAEKDEMSDNLAEETKGIVLEEKAVSLSVLPSVNATSVTTTGASSNYSISSSDASGTAVYNWSPPPPVTSVPVSSMKDVIDILYTAR